ncbi:endolytic transglycosylase MltG [Bacillus sp. FJAT-29937]|uniref:endolytic transglycosylase MltG n=1 Tax=Bacillus sp. FJAT-29937 TaxID=1720553 RepID=UPI0008364766|nr:endolytic transglycosylase MltG [Bacillus sp. FJAT-29937]
MNKRNTRAFAFGILVAVCIIGLFYFSVMKENNRMDIKDAKLLLERNGYIILTKEKYKDMENANKVEPKTEETPQKPPALTPKTEEIITAYTLEIISGMVSHDIASLLEKEKIIDDAEQFETYLEENGYSKRLQLGSYELKAGMSFKQIAKIITKS